jgi:hypothetical protein
MGQLSVDRSSSTILLTISGRETMLHDNQRINSTDAYFVCGGNPDNTGGGIIGSRQTFAEALILKIEAIKAGYRKVSILTWIELQEAK